MAEAKRVRIRYKPDHKDFGKLMMADQTQNLANQGARRGVIEAQALAMDAGLSEEFVDSIKARLGPPVVLGGNPRRTARVVAEHRLAGVFEFGSGKRNPREQGGSSPAYRILGQAAARTGALPDAVA